MAKYTPPEQSRFLQIVDIAFLIIAIFAALWLPLKAGWGRGPRKASTSSPIPPGKA